MPRIAADEPIYTGKQQQAYLVVYKLSEKLSFDVFTPTRKFAHKLEVPLGKMLSKIVILATLAALVGAETTASPEGRCTDETGNLLPSAQSCPDEIQGCDTVFKTAAAASPASRDPMCDVEILKDTALKCSKTCAICCENPNYNCKDAAGYEALCPTWKNTCASNVTSVRDAMAKYCPSTCGLCMQGSCTDALPDCAKMGVLCNDATFGVIWKQQTDSVRTRGTTKPSAARPVEPAVAGVKPVTN
uniref:ShKT domain-containing protein n=1 Tax=Steinernema glaseri TaxID=37863 RepID=A0A1I7Z4N4_9BILA